MSTLRIAGSNFTTASHTCNFNSNTATASVNITWPSEEPYYSLNITFSAVRELFAKMLSVICAVGF